MDDLGATAGRNSEMMVRIKKLTKKVAKYIQIGLTNNKTQQTDQYAQLPAHRRYNSIPTPGVYDLW